MTVMLIPRVLAAANPCMLSPRTTTAVRATINILACKTCTIVRPSITTRTTLQWAPTQDLQLIIEFRDSNPTILHAPKLNMTAPTTMGTTAVLLLCSIRTHSATAILLPCPACFSVRSHNLLFLTIRTLDLNKTLHLWSKSCKSQMKNFRMSTILKLTMKSHYKKEPSTPTQSFRASIRQSNSVLTP